MDKVNLFADLVPELLHGKLSGVNVEPTAMYQQPGRLVDRNDVVVRKQDL